jgi:hypothetical protein
VSSSFDYTVHEGSLDGPVVGTYRHAEANNDLAGPEHGDIIELDGLYGRWRVTAGHPPAMHRELVEPQGKGELVVERVADDLVAPHGH